MDAIPVSVAVQGGGSHGAFSWGMLDRLLDEVEAGRLTLRALSGASAGAFNATLTAYGLGLHPGDARAGARAARTLLQAFWEGNARMAATSMYSMTARAWHSLTGGWNIDATPVAMGLDMLSQVFSPYDWLQVDWLERVLGESVDFEALRRQPGPALYVSATNIADNRRDVFARSALTPDVLAASASIPSLYQARVLGGRPYWDGGYMGNPALSPLLEHAHEAADLVLLLVNPFERADMPPRTARAILDRLNELTFNTALLLELNTLEAVNALAAADPSGAKKELRLHCIRDRGDYMARLGVASKAVIVEEFLRELFTEGRRAAAAWLQSPTGGGRLGRQSSLGDLVDAHISRRNIIRSPPTRP